MKRARNSKGSAAASSASAAASSSAAAPAVSSSSSAAEPSAASSSSSALPASSTSAAAAAAHAQAMDEALNGYTEPLIGPNHQVDVPPFTSPPPASSSSAASATPMHEDPSIAGTVRWNPSIKGFFSSEKKREMLDKYLAVVDTLFSRETDRLVGHESALFFLHQCDYDIPAATRMLKPWAPPVEDEVDLDEEEMFAADDFCVVCRDGGNLVLCDQCGNKAYHPACVQLESVPSGSWLCPYHTCSVCAINIEPASASLSCSMCPTSFCAAHIPPDLAIRRAALGAQEDMCGPCLSKEEDYHHMHVERGHAQPGYSVRRAFLHRLQMVLKRETRQLVRMPILGQRELDLYALYTQVCRKGGIAAVLSAGTANGASPAAAAASSSSNNASASSIWREIRRALRLPSHSTHGYSSSLRRFYIHILYPYEKQFFSGFKPLTLKQAHAAEKDDNDEEDDDDGPAAVIAAPVIVPSGPGRKKKNAAALAAAAAAAANSVGADDYPLPPVDPSLLDDRHPDDVLLSLKVGGPGGAGVAMGSRVKAKGKEARAKNSAKKALAKEAEAKRKLKEKGPRGKKAAAAAAAAAAAKKEPRVQRVQRNKRDVSGKRGGAAAANGANGSGGRPALRKDHPCVNIYAPTPWAIAANSSATLQRSQASAAAAAAADAAEDEAAGMDGEDGEEEDDEGEEADVTPTGTPLVAPLVPNPLAALGDLHSSALLAGAASLPPAVGAAAAYLSSGSFAGLPLAVAAGSLAATALSVGESATAAADALNSKRRYQDMLMASTLAASAAAAAAVSAAAVAAPAIVAAPAAASSSAALASDAPAAMRGDAAESADDEHDLKRRRLSGTSAEPVTNGAGMS